MLSISADRELRPTTEALRTAAESLYRTAESSAAQVVATHQLLNASAALLENTEAAILRARQTTIETALLGRLIATQRNE